MTLPTEVLEAQKAEQIAYDNWRRLQAIANEAREVASRAAEVHAEAQRHTAKTLRAAVAKEKSL